MADIALPWWRKPRVSKCIRLLPDGRKKEPRLSLLRRPSTTGGAVDGGECTSCNMRGGEYHKQVKVPVCSEEQQVSFELNMEADADETCCICKEKDISNCQNTAAINGCPHLFCLKCIEEWAKRENSCPLCKIRFTRILYLSMGKNKTSFSRARLISKKVEPRTQIPTYPRALLEESSASQASEVGVIQIVEVEDSPPRNDIQTQYARSFERVSLSEATSTAETQEDSVSSLTRDSGAFYLSPSQELSETATISAAEDPEEMPLSSRSRYPATITVHHYTDDYGISSPDFHLHHLQREYSHESSSPPHPVTPQEEDVQSEATSVEYTPFISSITYISDNEDSTALENCI